MQSWVTKKVGALPQQNSHEDHTLLSTLPIYLDFHLFLILKCESYYSFLGDVPSRIFRLKYC